MDKAVLDVDKIMTQLGYDADKIERARNYVIHGKTEGLQSPLMKDDSKLEKQ